MTEKKRVIIYIDGFNFYFGLHELEEWKRFYWIDIVKLFKTFMKKDEELDCVRYYTARPKNEGKRERQNTLMKVNKNLNDNRFKIIYGKYIKKPIRCLAKCKEKFEIQEEKQTDVKLSVDILEDYIIGNCNKTILVSADSDLLPSVRSIKRLQEALNKKHDINIYFPPNRFSSDMLNSGFTVIQLKGYKSRFNKSILPYSVKTKKEKIVIPDKWRRQLEAYSTSH